MIAMDDAYRPGVVGDIVGAHARYYAEHWGLGLPFEVKVAGDLAGFLARRDPARDLLLCARDGDGGFLGSVAVDGIEAAATGAHLRWFIVGEAARGTGLGRRLLAAALDFAWGRGYPSVYLWTFAGLNAARHLYESTGFRLVEAAAAETWGRTLVEQRFACPRPGG